MPEGIIASNPMKLLDAKEKHQPAESVREYLTIDELKAIMKADCANTEVKKAFIFSCFAGLRLGDVRALTWNKVFLASDGKTKFVCTIMEKTNKLVNVPLSKEALNCLNEKEDPNEPIFTLPGTPTVCHDIRKWMQNADIKKHISFQIIVALSFLELKANKITIHCDFICFCCLKLVFLPKNHNVL